MNERRTIRIRAWHLLLPLAVLLLVAGLLLYQVPSIRASLDWKMELASAYVRGLVDPVKPLPTPRDVVQAAVLPAATATPPATATVTATVGPTQPGPSATPEPPTATPTITPTPTPIPSRAQLTPPEYTKQTANNCGPASLALYLRMFGWKGQQEDIEAVIKPVSKDRNVNVEELVYYVRTQVGWLNIEYRVGGSLETLKRILAAGLPIMIEKSINLESTYAGDDGWSGHYLLLTGYDDDLKIFTSQDSYLGPNKLVTYDQIDSEWRSFNRVFIMLYRPEEEPILRSILGDDWDPDINRRHALEQAQKETEANPKSAYAFFNLGTNLVYFDRYGEAAAAYDQARKLGLPNRMLRYQFGPFIAYFNTNRVDDLLALTEYALRITDNSEEAMLWRGWAFYRKGDTPQAIDWFTKAITVHPGYSDAEYALNFVRSN